MELHLDDMREGYIDLCKMVQSHGRLVAPRGQQTLEVLGAQLVLENPARNRAVGVGRSFSLRLAYAEALQLSGGFSDPETLTKLVPTMQPFVDHGIFHGAYGPRIAPQVPACLDRLRLDPDTRRATITIWDPARDLYQEDLHDYPCTISLQLMMRRDRLDLHTHMRSNDVWLGTPYDVFQFTFLQMNLAQILGVEAGTYYHHVDSLHLYQRDEWKVQGLSLAATSAGDSTWPIYAGDSTWPIPTSSYANLRRVCSDIWTQQADLRGSPSEGLRQAFEALHG